MLIAVIQPYKQEHSICNAVDLVLALMVAMLYTLLVGENEATLKAHTFVKAFFVLAYLVAVLPLL